MKTKTILITLLMAALLLIAVGCSKADSSDGEDLTGAVVNDVVLEVKDAADNVADAVGDAMGEAADTVKDALDDDAAPDAEGTDELVADENKPTLHRVKMSEAGFDPVELTVEVGDSIEWVNSRKAKAMVLGIKACSYLKSPVFSNGDSFQYEFTKADTCTLVDGIYTKVLPMKLTIVE
ncbi:MAG: hypothetical protein Q8Q01_05080 [archaeon]|nr:hypothetical protein [archaeon]